MIATAQINAPEIANVKRPVKAKSALQQWCTKLIPAQLKPQTFAKLQTVVLVVSTSGLVAILCQGFVSNLA